jgi:hypothetical protein
VSLSHWIGSEVGEHAGVPARTAQGTERFKGDRLHSAAVILNKGIIHR